MRCPLLEELPPPVPGRTGWPWTEACPQAPNAMPDGAPWPRVSIVTPSYNQGQFIEETIRSVLLQGYPDLEYIIIDGGSSDGSVEIIRKYEPWLAYWVSERDGGQSDGINKGWRLATGSWTNWVNSDDLLAPDALRRIVILGEACASDTIVAGDVVNFGDVRLIQCVRPRGIALDAVIRFWDRSCVWHQPGLYLPLQVVREVGYLDIRLHYAMDHDLLCRLLTRCDVMYLDQAVAYFRLHSGAKGVSQPARTAVEKIVVSRSYWSYGHARRWRYEAELGFWRLKAIGHAIKHANWAGAGQLLRRAVLTGDVHE